MDLPRRAVTSRSDVDTYSLLVPTLAADVLVEVLPQAYQRHSRLCLSPPERFANGAFQNANGRRTGSEA